MPRFSDIANVTHRGDKKIPSVTDDLPYSAYCLYEGVRSEMERSHQPIVTRGGVDGWEGPVSVPNIMKLLWPQMDNRSFRERESLEYQIRLALYQYLRDTRNMVCISPGDRFRMSTWWARKEWNDAPPEDKSGPVTVTKKDDSNSAAPVTASTEPAGERQEPAVEATACEVCGQEFLSARQKSRHFYSIHVSLSELILEALRQHGQPVGLIDFYELISQPPYNFLSSKEMLRHHLLTMGEDLESPLEVTGSGMTRRYSVRSDKPVTPPQPQPRPVEDIQLPSREEIMISQKPKPAVVMAELPGTVTLEQLMAGFDTAVSNLQYLAAEFRTQLNGSAAPHADSGELASLREENTRLREELKNLGTLLSNLRT